MTPRRPLPLVALGILAVARIASAAPVRGVLSETGLTLVALGADGGAVSTADQRFAVTPRDATGRLVLVAADTTVHGPVVLAIKVGRRVYSVPQARKKQACTKAAARAVMVFNARKPLDLGRVRVEASVAYPTRRIPPKKLDATTGLARVDASCVPAGAGKLGIGAADAAVVAAAETDPAAGKPGEDPDQDGMASAVDADDDGDGILDNDDEGSGGVPRANNPKSFWVFSNFHNDIQDSLNANALTVTKEMVDAALVRSAGLAIQVVESPAGSPVELDCGALAYCSQGGTGRSREPYPDGAEFPEAADPDGNGLGTITVGNGTDFQLACFEDAPAGYAASDAIRAGDVFLQRYTDETGAVVEVPGMLNFIFHTTPAVKQVVTGVRTYDVAYPVPPGAPGTRENPFHVPSTGDVAVTLTVWRPQRQGVPGAGEADLMDMGNLRVVTNIPNGPCAGELDSTCEQGPGLCAGEVYTTTDPNLTVRPDGLQDAMGDRAADPANTFTYTLRLSQCVESAPGVTWDAGEWVKVPLQMMNVYGDNAVQNVFFVRDDS